MSLNMLVQTGALLKFPTTIKYIKEAGFSGVYINANGQKITLQDIEFILKSDLTIGSLHLPYNEPFNIINALWLNDSSSENAIKILKEHINFAHHSGIKIVILHASSGYDPPIITDAGLRNYLVVIEYALRHNIKLAIENIKRVDYVEALLNKFQCKEVGFCFDIGHANAFTHNLYSYNWKPLLKRLMCVHLHDNNGVSDLHLLPGMGEIDFNFVLGLFPINLRQIDFSVEGYYGGREIYYKGMEEKNFFLNAFKYTKENVKWENW